MLDLNVKIDSDKLTIYIDKVTPAILKVIQDEINIQGGLLADYINRVYLRTGGGGSSTLASRSGLLSRSLKALPATIVSGDVVQGGIQVGAGVPYSRVHINAEGTSTTIKKKNKYLTIPVGPALTKGGSTRKANARAFPDLFVWKNKKTGQRLLVRSVKGVGKGSSEGKLIPYFILKDSVTIRSRVHPELILRERAVSIRSGLEKAIAGVMNG
jgi:hypothetical protein